MSDDVQVVAANVVGPNPSAEMEEEVNAHQDAPAAAEEEQADTAPEDDVPQDDVSACDAEPGEDDAGESAASVPAPARREAKIEEPYDFDRCTIQIGLQLLPDDGDPAGRPVVVGVRNHADVPIVAFTRLSALGPLPQAVTELLDRLRAELPARKTAKEEAADRKKAEEEAAKARREAARAKPRSDAKSAPKKVKGLAQAPESGPAPSSAPVVAAPLFDAPKASEQISLF
jgi:hypothetical protein